jgi:hypothetical protein
MQQSAEQAGVYDPKAVETIENSLKANALRKFHMTGCKDNEVQTRATITVHQGANGQQFYEVDGDVPPRFTNQQFADDTSQPRGGHGDSKLCETWKEVLSYFNEDARNNNLDVCWEVEFVDGREDEMARQNGLVETPFEDANVQRSRNSFKNTKVDGLNLDIEFPT